MLDARGSADDARFAGFQQHDTRGGEAKTKLQQQTAKARGKEEREVNASFTPFFHHYGILIPLVWLVLAFASGYVGWLSYESRHRMLPIIVLPRGARPGYSNREVKLLKFLAPTQVDHSTSDAVSIAGTGSAALDLDPSVFSLSLLDQSPRRQTDDQRLAASRVTFDPTPGNEQTTDQLASRLHLYLTVRLKHSYALWFSNVIKNRSRRRY